jgi:hypothetical protein
LCTSQWPGAPICPQQSSFYYVQDERRIRRESQIRVSSKRNTEIKTQNMSWAVVGMESSLLLPVPVFLPGIFFFLLLCVSYPHYFYSLHSTHSIIQWMYRCIFICKMSNSLMFVSFLCDLEVFIKSITVQLPPRVHFACSKRVKGIRKLRSGERGGGGK